MKINIFIKYFSEYGGAERVCYRFAWFLHERNEDVTIYCGLNRVNREMPFKVVELRLPKTRYGRAKVYGAKASAAAKAAEGVNFSFERIENAHIFRPGGGIHSFFMKNTLRGLTGLDKTLKIMSRAINPVNRLNPKLEQKTFASPSLRYIIANSHTMKREIVSEYPETDQKIHVIHNGINKKIFNPSNREKYRQPHEGILIGIAAGAFERKGLPQLLGAIALLPSRYSLVIAGGRNPDKYIAIARKLGVENRVRFLGKVTEMEKFYASLDVFCLPSFFEGFANVVSESVGMGIPVACSIYSGSNEIITDGENGYVFDVVEPAKIADCIAKAAALGTGDYSGYVDSDDDVFQNYLDLCSKAAEQ